jgi:very-short-patch-repair endonuclease
MKKLRKTVERARALRREMTRPELRLWQFLRTRPEGFKFRRQHPVGPYVLDFYCAHAMLAVEVDGAAHDMGENPQRDERRDAWLAEQGVRTLRIPAVEIFDDLEAAATAILTECRRRGGISPPPPSGRSPSPSGDGEDE